MRINREESRASKEDLHEWERHERELYNRFMRKMKRVGCAIIIITLLWSLGWMYKILMLLINE